MITLDLSILNQKGTPMFYSDIFANRPAFGIVGRIFISTDTAAIYRDTGTSWVLIADGTGTGTITGSGTAGTLPIWTASSVLGDSSLLEGSTKITTIKDIQADGYYLTGMTAGTGALYHSTVLNDRVTLANYNVGGTVYIEVNGGTYAAKWDSDLSLTNYGYIAATPILSAANNASSVAIYGQNTLSYAAGFSSNNIGAIYTGTAGFNLQTFAGSATFAQANVASGLIGVNSIDFSSAGSTITMTQSSGIRAMTGNQSQIQYQGTNSATISHAAISQNLGFYRPSGASNTLTITNAYSHLINALDDYGAGFIFTNRWGIYQAGASDKNYFAGNMLLGSVVDNGDRLQTTGNSTFIGSVGIGTNIHTHKLDVLSSDFIVQFNQSTFVSGSNYFSALLIGYQKLSNQAGEVGYVYNSVNPSASFTYLNTWGQIQGSQFQLTANGNIGLGVTPSAWKNGWKTIQLSSSSITSDGAQYQTGFNFYLNSSGNDIYINSDTATKYQQVLGQHIWYNAPSGTAGNPITFTQAMTLNASGFLGIGVTNPISRLQINGSSRFEINSGATADHLFSINGVSNGYRIQIDLSNNITYSWNTGTNASAMVVFPNGNVDINNGTDSGAKFRLNGSLRIDGQSSATAGGSSGQHLIINLDGTTYKIALLNP